MQNCENKNAILIWIIIIIYHFGISKQETKIAFRLLKNREHEHGILNTKKMIKENMGPDFHQIPSWINFHTTKQVKENLEEINSIWQFLGGRDELSLDWVVRVKAFCTSD